MNDHKKDWVTLTKLLTYITIAILIIVVGFTIFIVAASGDTTPLLYLIPSTEALAGATIGFYIWKSKFEYKVNKFCELIRELKDSGVEITSDLLHAFSVDL